MKLSLVRPALAAVTAGSLCLLLGACGALESAATGKSDANGKRQLLLGHGAAPGNPRTVAADAFAKEVSDQTSGRITVQVQGSEQLGSDTQMLQSVKAGTLDLSANSQGPLSASVPEAALIGLPFLFKDSEQAYAVLDGPVGDQIAALAEKQGFKVLAWWDNGIRNITNNKRPITSPKDVAGLKIRTPDDPMTVDIFKALGANPTPLAFGELYLALRQGTVDGQENPLTNIASAKLNEVQKYLALTGHKYESTPFVISLKTWNSLSKDDQQVVQDAAEHARDQQRELMQKQDEQLRTELAKTMKITTPDKEPFRKATASVYDSWSAKYPELVSALQDAAKG